jgi:hypothetical protein
MDTFGASPEIIINFTEFQYGKFCSFIGDFEVINTFVI